MDFDDFKDAKVEDFTPVAPEGLGELSTPEGDKIPETNEPVPDAVPEANEETKTEAAPEAKEEGTVETPETVVTEPAVVIPDVVKTWQEQVKAVDKWEALKEMGLDEFEIDLLKYRAETGDLTPYLEAKTVDYTKLADTEIMRRSLLKQYPGLTTEELEMLYEEDVIGKYKLTDDFDETEKKKGLLRLKLDAGRLRTEAIDNQKKFKAPDRPTPEFNATETAKKQQEAFIAQAAKDEASVRGDAATKELLQSKRLAIKSADGIINFEVNADDLVSGAVDQGKFWSKFAKDGVVNLHKFYKINAYATDPEKYEKALIDYGKGLGRKAEFTEIKNPSKPETGTVAPQTFSDEMDGIANAFATKGVRR